MTNNVIITSERVNRTIKENSNGKIKEIIKRTDNEVNNERFYQKYQFTFMFT